MSKLSLFWFDLIRSLNLSVMSFFFLFELMQFVIWCEKHVRWGMKEKLEKGSASLQPELLDFCRTWPIKAENSAKVSKAIIGYEYCELSFLFFSLLVTIYERELSPKNDWFAASCVIFHSCISEWQKLCGDFKPINNNFDFVLAAWERTVVLQYFENSNYHYVLVYI